MMNPNRSYQASQLAVITHVDEPDAYIPYLRLRTRDGQAFEGSLSRCHSRWKSLKPGMCVAFSCTFSITADKFLVDTVIVKRRVPQWVAEFFYTCKLCGQHITDGKPCGCGARY